MKKLSGSPLFLVIISAPILILLALFFCDRLWRRMVIDSVRNATATDSGATVVQVLTDKLSNKLSRMVWRVENGDFPYLEARVFYQTCENTDTQDIFVWQWDASWPSVRDLTPVTVQYFPRLDPGCFLTPDGRSTLKSGRKAISLYFSSDIPQGGQAGNTRSSRGSTSQSGRLGEK